MSNEKIIEIVKKFYDNEVKENQTYINHLGKYDNRPKHEIAVVQERVTKYTIQRCLGVAFFVQKLGIPFEEIDELYNKTVERIEETVR